MNKNIIKFFLLTTFILLFSASLVSANDIANDTTDVGVVSVDNNVKSVNKEVKINNYKLSETSTDYYVSDTNGSDNNTGTNSSSPFKTIQTALDKTTSTGTYNIHIGAGTYKGLGNTNLTVNGSHTINIIGSGVNSTILDGEASYTISTGTIWGSDEYWNKYNYNYGNWGLNITKGNGKVTITGLNVQNMISPGGTSIEAYETATIDNYGNLEVDSAYFYNNLAGVGAGIRNNNGSTLLVNNTIFEGGRKCNSTGNYGGAIYNNGTAIIDNSKFIKNMGRWGVITNDKILNISNSIIRDGISYDLGSTYKSGSGISIDTSRSDYFNPYKTDDPYTFVENCIFINNGQSDIYCGLFGYLSVNNSVFNNSTGIVVASNYNNSANITNSQFINMSKSSYFSDLSGLKGVTFSICKENNGTVNIKNNTMGEGIIIISGSNTIFTNNTVNTSKDYAINITGKNNSIFNNSLESKLFYGNNAILNVTGNIIENNTPNDSKNSIVTMNTYNMYFDDNGLLKNDISNNVLYLSGNFTDKNMIFTNNDTLTIIGIDDVNIINGILILNGSGKINITNISMITTDSTINSQLIINSSNNNIQYSKFYTNSTGVMQTIKILKDNNALLNNNITTNAQAKDITYDNDNYGICDTIGLLITSSNNTIYNNTINTTSTTNNGEYNTITGVSIQSKDNTAKNNNLTLNWIYARGDKYTIGLNIHNSHDNILQNTRLQSGYMVVSGNIYTYGIQLTGNITNNKINTSITLSSSIVYGVILDGYVESKNNNLTGISIQSGLARYDSDKANETIGIIVNNSDKTDLTNATMQLNSTKSIGIIINNITNSFLNTASVEIYENNTENTAYILNNSNNISLNGSRSSTSSGIGIQIINSTNIDIQPITRTIGKATIVGQKPTIKTPTIGISLINSSNIKINNANISSKLETIIINNTSNVLINNSYLLENEIIGGDNSIKQINAENITRTNNKPEIITLNNDNYNTYFTNSTLNVNTNSRIVLESDLYNKDLIIPIQVEFYGNNHTIYNGTITFINKSTGSLIYDTNFNSTDNRKSIIKITMPTIVPVITINNSKIYHKSNDVIETLYSNATRYNLNINNSEIIIEGLEIETEDDSTSILLSQIVYLYHSNVTISSNDNNGAGKIEIIGSNGTIYNSSINIKGNNILAFKNTDLEDNIINIQGQNVTLIEVTTDNIRLYNNLIKINATNNARGYITMENSYSIFNNNLSVFSNNTGSIFEFGKYSTKTHSNHFTSNYIYGENVNGVIIENAYDTGSTYITALNLIINNTKNRTHIPLLIKNSTSIFITNSNITSNNNESNIIIEDSKDIQIESNYLSSNTLKGEESISLTNTSNITRINNTPGLILTNGNYDEYFTDNIYNGIYTTIELGSDIHNKTMKFTNMSITLINPNNYTLYNTTINLYNLIISTFDNLILDYNGNNKDIIEINNTHSSITFQNIKIKTKGNNNRIYYINSEKIPVFIFNNTIFAIGENNTILQLENDISFTQIQYNNITIETNTTNPAIILNTSSQTYSPSFENNTILVNNTYGTNPIIYTNKATSIRFNYIQSNDLVGNNAIYTTDDNVIANNTPVDGEFIAQLNITTPNTILNGTTNNITINVSDILGNPVNGGYIRIISENSTIISPINEGIAHTGYIPEELGEQNITITLDSNKYTTNNITLTVNVEKLNTTIKTTPLKGYINQNLTLNVTITDTNGNNVTEGNIYFIDDKSNVRSTTVNNGVATLTGFNTTYTGNIIIRYAGTSGYYASNTTTNITITKHNTTITVDKVVGVVGESITLIARIVDESGNNVTSGRVLFKINGVTLRDTNGSVIYVNVTNGVAHLTLTAVRGWTNTNAYISANYAGNSVYLTSISKNSTVNIAKRNATIEIINDTRVYKAGDTITITAIVTDSNGQLAMSGQVVFKLNGVTLKDRNGKTIMVNVVNGVATLTYTLPSTFADYNYIITAIFAGGDYNRQVSKNSTLQVVKTSIHMDLDPVITTTNTATIRAKIYDGNNKQITGITRVTIKLNGVTIINSQNITNGNLQFTINTPYKTGLYNMTIIAGPSSVYEQLQRNTTLVIMKN